MLASYVPTNLFWIVTFFRVLVAVAFVAACLLTALHFAYSYLRWKSEPDSPPLFNIRLYPRPHTHLLVSVFSVVFSAVTALLLDPIAGLIAFVGYVLLQLTIHLTWGQPAVSFEAPKEYVELTDVAKEILLRELRKKPDDH
jgi:hypothetical protein